MFINFLERAIRKFLADDCYAKASALSYYTILSFVPILAVAFGIAKGFGFDQSLEQVILDTFYQQKEIALKIISFARSTLEQTKGSLIAGVGALALFWTSFGLLGNLEKAFNTIWNAAEERSLPKRIIDFLPLLIFLPFFFVASSSATFLIVTKVVELSEKIGIYQTLKPFIYLIYYGLLIFLSWALLAFTYIYLPNKRPHYRSIAVASLLAAIIFQASQWGYIHLQVYLTSYNAIYGSFAAIPLFLIWLQISWLIVLTGAEMATLLATPRLQHADPSTTASQEELLLALCILTTERADVKNPLKGVSSISRELKLQDDQAQKWMRLALKHQLIIESHGLLYPARSLSLITPEEIRRTLESEQAEPAGDSPYLLAAKQRLSSLQ